MAGLLLVEEAGGRVAPFPGRGGLTVRAPVVAAAAGIADALDALSALVQARRPPAASESSELSGVSRIEVRALATAVLLGAGSQRRPDCARGPRRRFGSPCSRAPVMIDGPVTR